jgi:hypothetical protein
MVSVPPEGVASFRPNFYLSPEDLASARSADNMVCPTHGPKFDLDIFCVDCSSVVCVKCVVADHKTHFVVELTELVGQTKIELSQAEVR